MSKESSFANLSLQRCFR